ncbi:MAG: hypothetical protein PHR20_02375 [Bacteroidales bacterium]|nr:hypothetical protein [Bacteroidales bacterium]
MKSSITSFLCGSFSLKLSKADVLKSDSRWTETKYDVDKYNNYCSVYYKRFVNCMCPDASNVDDELLLQSSFFHLPLEDKKCVMHLLNGREYEFNAKAIDLYLMPFDVVIYSISISETCEDLNDMTSAHCVLREVRRYSKNNVGDAFLEVIALLMNFLKNDNSAATYNDLIENGNKMKVFQIIDTKEQSMVNNKLLFELGTLSRVGSLSDENDNNRSSEEYFKFVIDNHLVSVFNNWKALALFDTFTILANNPNQYVMQNWEESYFKLCYIHAFFLKSYLFNINQKLVEKGAKKSELEDDFFDFEKSYRFRKISYNFLPQIIYESMDKGLDINAELDRLQHFVERDAAERASNSDKSLNMLLLLLTFLTVFSTLTDATNLFSDMFPIETRTLSFRLIAYILIFFIVTAIIITLCKKQKNDRS